MGRDGAERLFVAEAARWYDAYLWQHPGDLHAERIRDLLSAGQGTRVSM
jgi:hypothetical protein